MSKQTKSNIKNYAFIALIASLVVGAGVVGVPQLDLDTWLQLAYYGLAGGVLIFVTLKR